MHDAPHDHVHSGLGGQPLSVRIVRRASGAGAAGWNRGRPPEDWWREIENRHGHVGPWNVLGYRMGQCILRELGMAWGSHESILTAHIPASTPYSCLLDGLAVGTGNSEGRLDLLWAEVALPEFTHVSVRRARDRELLLVLMPHPAYLEIISQGTVADLEPQARACAELPETSLFTVRRLGGQAGDD